MQISQTFSTTVLLLFALSITSISGGIVQTVLEALEREGLPYVYLPEEFDDKFEQAMRALLSPNRKYTLIQNG